MDWEDYFEASFDSLIYMILSWHEEAECLSLRKVYINFVNLIVISVLGLLNTIPPYLQASVIHLF